MEVVVDTNLLNSLSYRYGFNIETNHSWPIIDQNRNVFLIDKIMMDIAMYDFNSTLKHFKVRMHLLLIQKAKTKLKFATWFTELITTLLKLD